MRSRDPVTSVTLGCSSGLSGLGVLGVAGASTGISSNAFDALILAISSRSFKSRPRRLACSPRAKFPLAYSDNAFRASCSDCVSPAAAVDSGIKNIPQVTAKSGSLEYSTSRTSPATSLGATSFPSAVTSHFENLSFLYCLLTNGCHFGFR